MVLSENTVKLVLIIGRVSDRRQNFAAEYTELPDTK